VNGQTEYNDRGLPVKKYLPYFSTAAFDTIVAIDPSIPSSSIEYDAMGRTKKTINPDLTFTEVIYDKWSVQTFDENRHKQESIFDAYGRLIQKIEYTGTDPGTYAEYTTTNYTYDSEGNLAQVQDDQNNITTITYGKLGRKVSMNDPDMGTWTYDYDLNGNLINQIDAKSQQIDFTYDEINRLVNKADQSVLNVDYMYDDPVVDYSKGRLTAAVYELSDFTQFAYDPMGRETQSNKMVGGVDYDVQRNYDALSRLTSIQYPEGSELVYTYNQAGQIETVSNEVIENPDPVEEWEVEYDASGDQYPDNPAQANQWQKIESGGDTGPSPFTHFKLNDSEVDFNVIDNGTGANNGSASNLTEDLSTVGKINLAFAFNGIDENVSILAVESEITEDTKGSLALWFSVNTVDVPGVMFSVSDDFSDSSLYVRIDDPGILDFYIVNGGSTVLNARVFGIEPSRWYHAAFVQDEQSLTVYLDGQERTDAVISGPQPGGWLANISTTTNSFIGCFKKNNLPEMQFYDGKLDDFRYYSNIVLSEPDIALIYNGGSGTEQNAGLVSIINNPQCENGKCLNIGTDPQSSEMLKYAHGNAGDIWVDSADPATGYTIETRLKVIDSGSVGQVIAFNDGVKKQLFYVNANQAGFRYGGQQTVNMNTTDTFHTYRLVVQGTSVDLYVDENLSLTDTLVATGLNRLRFGDNSTSTDTGGEVYWDYIRYTTQGANAPLGSGQAKAPGTDIDNSGLAWINEQLSEQQIHHSLGFQDGEKTELQTVSILDRLRGGLQYFVSSLNDFFTVKEIYAQAVPNIVIDNLDAQIIGPWNTSSTVPNYYATNYLWNNSGSGSDKVIWRPGITTIGNYEVYYWLPKGYSTRPTDAEYTIYHNGGSQTYIVNQQDPGGQWILLGTHDFILGTSGYVELTDNNSGQYTIADAVMFIYAGGPQAPIVTISANPETIIEGQSSLLTWSSTNADSCIASGGWSGSRPISGSEAVSPIITTTYTLDCTGSEGSSSDSATVTVTPPSTDDIIIDNLDAQIIGPWGSSSYMPNYYATNYLWNQSGSGSDKVNWRPQITTAGNYEIYYWLPNGASTRPTDAEYTVYYNGGSLIYPVNQQLPGGTWNLLGTHAFSVGTTGYVELSDNNSGQWTIADAVKFVYAGEGGDVPSAPVSNPPVSGDRRVTLSWSSVEDATGYHVRYGTSSGTYGAPIAVGNVTTHTVTGLTNGTTYYFVVTAANENGESAYSNEESGTPAELVVSAFIEDVDYNATGQITKIFYGNGTKTYYKYNDLTLRLDHLKTFSPSIAPIENSEGWAEFDDGDIQDLAYEYDNVGNIMHIEDIVNTSTQDFIYDEQNRLVQAFAPNSYGTKTYAYDTIGNITEKDGLTYTYGENGAGPHAVTSLSDGSSFSYDENGNMSRMIKDSITWDYVYDAENRLIEVHRNSFIKAEYEYDGDGGRVKKTVHSNQNAKLEDYFPQGRRQFASLENEHQLVSFDLWDFVDYLNPLHVKDAEALINIVKQLGGSVTTTTYIGSLYEETNGAGSRHSYLGGTRIATVHDNFVSYYHNDHLGGTNVITDSQGSVKELVEYHPFGTFSRQEKYGTPEETAWRYFTGKKFDDETGLYFYGARYYNPSLGRFITPDSISPEPFNSASLNRYIYVKNNPINLTDPTGHFWFIPAIIGAIKAATAAATAFAIAHPIIAGAAAGGLLGGVNAAISGTNIAQGIGLGTLGGAIGAGIGVGVGGFLEKGLGTFWAGTIGSGFGGASAAAATTAILGGDVGLGALAGMAGAVVAFGGSRAWPLGADAIAGGVSSVIQGGKFGEGAKFGAIDNAMTTMLELALPMKTIDNQDIQGGDLVFIKAQDPLGALIAFVEGGAFSHVGTVIDSKRMVSATPGGGVTYQSFEKFKGRQVRVNSRFRGNQQVIQAAKAQTVAKPPLTYNYVVGGRGRICSTCVGNAISVGTGIAWTGIGPNSQYNTFKTFGE